MKKRKQKGILKYGSRAGAVRKFQSGGTTYAAAGMYEWRNDPYEMMLLKDRLNDENRADVANAGPMGRYGGSSGYRPRRSTSGYTKPTKPPVVKKEEVIQRPLVKEGLPATVAYYNKLLKVQFKGLTDLIDEYGPDIMKKNVFQQRVEEVKSNAETYSFSAKKEKDRLEKAMLYMGDSQDQNAYAISNIGEMFVYDTNKKDYAIVSKDKYMDNITVFAPKTKGELVEYIRNNYMGDKSLPVIDSFIGNGALNFNSVEKIFMEGRRENFKYRLIGDQIKNASEGMDAGYITTADLMKKAQYYIRNDINTGRGAENIMNKSISDIASAIYRDALDVSDNTSAFRASLLSEVFKNKVYLQYLDSLDADERKPVLERMIKAQLLSKVFDSTLDLSNLATASKSETVARDPKASPLLASIYELVFSGSVGSKFALDEKDDVVIESSKEGVINSVGKLRLPTKTNYISINELELATTSKDAKEKGGGNIIDNKVINKYADTNEVLTPEGIPYSTILGGSIEANIMLKNNSTINPFAPGISLVWMPIDKRTNKIAVAGMANTLNKLKIKALKKIAAIHNAYYKSVGKDNYIDPSLITGMLRNNFKDKSVKAQMVAMDEFIAFSKRSNKTESGDKELVKVSKKVNSTILDLKKDVKEAYGDNIRLDKYLAISMIINNDYKTPGGKRFEELYRANKKNGSIAVRIAKSNEKNVLDDIWDMDTVALNVFRPDAIVTTALVKAKKSNLINDKERPNSLASLPRTSEAELILNSIIERKFIITAVDVDEYYDFLKLNN